jgi:glycosyltransferase involved in cell wall biosynthesis
VQETSNKKIRAFIIGDGEERKRLETMCEALGLSHTSKRNARAIVTFTSWIKDIDVSNAGMDIIALTSLNEGTPVSLIEAQASGKPIVSSNVGGIANIVQDGKTALLSASRDVNAFSENLLRLVENDELRNQLSGNGVTFVMENYSHLRLAKDMSNLYRSLLG